MTMMEEEDIYDAVASFRESQKPDYETYDKVILEFGRYMRKELEANYLKGDRNGRLGWMNNKNNKSWISELYYHVGKLQSALMNDDIKRVAENCADIANLAMMTLDVKINLLMAHEIIANSSRPECTEPPMMGMSY
jgi:hypothetical protein